MRKQSESYPNVYSERWKTPVSDIEYINLGLSGVLQTITQTHFFLNSYYEIDKKIHVATIPRTYPYRLIEEEFAVTCISKYFIKKDSNGAHQKKMGRSPKPSSTWKLWGTSFIQELDEGHSALSRNKNKKDICEYLIITSNEWIEIVDCEPTWEVHRNIKIEKLLEHYVKTKYRSS